MSQYERNCLFVTGFNKDIERKTLLTEFRRFGRVNKLFLENQGKFAKVFFADRQSAEAALGALHNSHLNWQISFYNSHHNYKMAHYNDDYEDEDFSENFDYCNIHGQPLVVLQADSGDLYVNLKDIRRTGFSLFRRDTFDSVLVDNRQIGKEFQLHLLSEAKNYILKNRVAAIDEEQILKTIERCKNKLLGENRENNTLGAGRCVSQSSRTITISSNVQQTAFDAGPHVVPQGVHQRPPKTLPNNFMPTQVQRGDKSKAYGAQDQQQYQRGRRDNGRYNSGNASRSENSLSSSTSSETKFSFKKPEGGLESASRVQQKSPVEKKEKIPKITFELKNIYDVTVSHKEKDNVCWVQDKKYANELEQVVIQVNELAETLEPISPLKGQLVIAKYEGLWNRGQVASVEPLIVEFIDYGNKSRVDVVKALPDSLKAVPMLANRITIDNSQELKEEMDLKIFIKHKVFPKYETGTYVVNLLDDNNEKINKETTFLKANEKVSKAPQKSKEVPDKKPPSSDECSEQPKQKSYFVIPKPLTDLCDGDMVMLVDIEDNKFLVRTKECALKSKALTDCIKNLDKTLPSNVNVGQLVLSSKDGFAGLFRAVVVKQDSSLIVTVKYIDFPGEADLSVKSLRNVDEFLATEPASILMTPEFKSLENLNEEAAEYVSTICQNKEKFKMILSGGNFDLQAPNGTLLSQILEDFKCPEPTPEETPALLPSTSKESVTTETIAEVKPVVVENDKVFYDEMDWIKIEPGSYSFMCYCLQDIDDVTFLSSTEDVISYLETITNVNPTDEEPYRPDASEMCLTSYKGPDDDEATWYRAVVLSEEEDNYVINFVDFGNVETVKSKDIRKFPAHLKVIPILGIGCSCIGLPKKPEILGRLKELMPEGTEVEVLVKGLDGLKYQIELPELYKQLKAEELF